MHAGCAMSRRLSEEGRAYYQRVEGIVDSEDFNTDDTGVFITNLFEQIVKDGAVKAFCDKVASRVMEKVFQRCPTTADNVLMLMEEIQANLPEMCSSSSGSHAVEAFLHQAAQHCKQGSDSASQAVEESVLTVCSSVLEDFGEYLTDFWANHVVRCLLQVLSGIRVADGIVRSRMCAAYRSKNAMSVQIGKKFPLHHQQQHVLDRRDVPERFVVCLNRFGKKLCKQKPLEDLLCNENVSPVYEVALVVLAEKSQERGQKLVKKILKCAKSPSKGPEEKEEEVLEALPSLFCDTIGSRVIEVMVEVLSPELLQMVYHQSFRHRVMQMALHPVANYVLQCFFARANTAQVEWVVQSGCEWDGVGWVDDACRPCMVKCLSAGMKCGGSFMHTITSPSISSKEWQLAHIQVYLYHVYDTNATPRLFFNTASIYR